MSSTSVSTMHAPAGPSPSSPWLGRVAELWGTAGFLALLANAVWRLTPTALAALDVIDVSGAILYAAMVVFFAYSEGYRGFQLRFSPRFAARGQHLSRNPRPLHVVLAPLYCMGLLHARRSRLLLSWAVTAAILAAVIVVRQLPQPWRGIVDGGVVVGLAWGAVATARSVLRARGGTAVDPEVP